MKKILVLLLLAFVLVGMAGAANYMYEKSSVKGVGYKNVEMVVSTQIGYNGLKLVEKESGSGNVISERTELEAERQLYPSGEGVGGWKAFPCEYWDTDPTSSDYGDDAGCAMDYINFTKTLSLSICLYLTRPVLTTRSGSRSYASRTTA